jgi:hypothetical protein
MHPQVRGGLVLSQSCDVRKPIAWTSTRSSSSFGAFATARPVEYCNSVASCVVRYSGSQV